jgi:hypothetical protein
MAMALEFNGNTTNYLTPTQKPNPNPNPTNMSFLNHIKTIDIPESSTGWSYKGILLKT